MKPNANFSQFLKPDSKSSQPPSRAEVIKSLDERDAILQDFISIWYTNYLLSLRSLYTWVADNESPGQRIKTVNEGF